MRVECDACLFYGIVLCKKECSRDHPWGDDEWKDYFIQQQICSPELNDDERIVLSDWNYVGHLELVQKLLNGVGVDFFSYADTTPCCYVSFTSMDILSFGGDAVEITPDKLIVPDDVDDKIKTFCEIMKLEYTQPKWWMVSSYG
jgi:hypothetical protein